MTLLVLGYFYLKQELNVCNGSQIELEKIIQNELQTSVKSETVILPTKIA